MTKNRYSYKEFGTGKLRYTRGEFIGWTKPTGILTTRYAKFQRRCSTLLVPDYLLTQETRNAITEEKNHDNLPDRFFDPADEPHTFGL